MNRNAILPTSPRRGRICWWYMPRRPTTCNAHWRRFAASGARRGVALNPHTPLSVLDYVLEDVDMVLIMSVNPGFGGQKFLPATYRKIRDLRAMLDARGLSAHIQVDGGVDPSNTAALVDSGADVLVSGSAFFGFPPYDQRLRAFEDAAAAARPAN